MIIMTCRPTKREHVDLYATMESLSLVHPQIKEIIDQVNTSAVIDKLDKKMIEQQLISMACTLNEAKSYTLVLDRWRGGNPCSAERERVSMEEKTIRYETIFSIISYGRKKNWTAFVDLPISVELLGAEVVAPWETNWKRSKCYAFGF